MLSVQGKVISLGLCSKALADWPTVLFIYKDLKDLGIIQPHGWLWKEIGPE